MKKILGVHDSPPMHWVGDGFPVRSMFSYDGLGQRLSPFLLLDHAAPMDFPPSPRPRGVGWHPHRGFETVTIVYQGEVAHRDSTGAGGVIGPGDVQWMTAAGGILHEEFHSPALSRSGGTVEMAQLWVNLPARHKADPPGYQNITAAQIPVLDLPEGAGTARVIAGTLDGHTGPARTFTRMDVWDLRLSAGGSATLATPPGHTLALAVLRGTVQVNGDAVARAGQLVVLSREGEGAVIEANNEAVVLWLAGEPINEPVVGYGPFVMNSQAEIRQAIEDFNSGRFGRMQDGGSH